MTRQTAEIVAAYVKRHRVDPAELPALIASVNQALATLGKTPTEPEPTKLTPAVPIRRSVEDGSVICLDCGFRATMLKRHLLTAHGLTPAEYRRRWNLASDHLLVAPDYAARRSAISKSFGFGRHRKPEGTPSAEGSA